jgi:hypothetical protein
MLGISVRIKINLAPISKPAAPIIAKNIISVKDSLKESALNQAQTIPAKAAIIAHIKYVEIDVPNNTIESNI